MQQYNVESHFNRIAIDGPSSETEIEYKYILVAINDFLKWVKAYALRNREAAIVVEAFVKVLDMPLWGPTARCLKFEKQNNTIALAI